MSEFVKRFEWSRLSNTNQHMVLMYLYRTLTDMDNIELYLETQRVREMKFNLQDLPTHILNSKPSELRAMAYAVIKVPLPKE